MVMLKNGADVETSQPIRSLEYCYLLMAKDISNSFVVHSRSNNHVLDYDEDTPLVGDVGENLVALYYNIYKTIHASRLYLQNVG